MLDIKIDHAEKYADVTFTTRIDLVNPLRTEEVTTYVVTDKENNQLIETHHELIAEAYKQKHTTEEKPLEVKVKIVEQVRCVSDEEVHKHILNETHTALMSEIRKSFIQS